jgi:DNA-binding beta-propeller fold protein YncE
MTPGRPTDLLTHIRRATVVTTAAAAFSALLVTCDGSSPSPDQTVREIPSGVDVAAKFPNPVHWRAFVALEDQAAVAVLERRGAWQVARRTRVAPGPHNLSASAPAGRVAVTSPPAERVTLLNLFGRIVARVPVSGSPHDVAFTPDGRVLWVSAEGAGRLVKLTPRSGRRLRERNTAGAPHDLAVSSDGRWLWVTIDGSDRIEVRDAHSGRLIARPALGGAPHDLAFAPGGQDVWLSNFGTSLLTVASAQTRRPVEELSAGAEPHHFVFGLGSLWVSDNRGGALLRLDPASGRIRGRTPVGPMPHHVETAGGQVLVAVHGSGRVAIVSRRGRLRARIPVGAGPHGIDAIKLRG